MHPFSITRLEFRLAPRRPLQLAPGTAANVIRGAFGTIFRRLVCDPLCPGARTCPARHSCAYAQVFEPGPPPGSTVLAKIENIPRGFVIRAPQTQTLATLDFELLLFGSAAAFRPHFEQVFAKLASEGFGPDRAPTDLLGVRELPVSLDTPAVPKRVTVRFISPTHLVSHGVTVRDPQFSSFFKRLRDRINALATFYGSGQLAVDFAGLGAASEQVETVWRDRHVESYSRTSSRTGQRHAIFGFVGECEFTGDLAPFWEWLVLGQHCHVGRHAVWGNGRYLLLD